MSRNFFNSKKAARNADKMSFSAPEFFLLNVSIWMKKQLDDVGGYVFVQKACFRRVHRLGGAYFGLFSGGFAKGIIAFAY